MFWFRFCRLLMSVFLEGVVFAFHVVLFPLRRFRERERIRAIMSCTAISGRGVSGKGAPGRGVSGKGAPRGGVSERGASRAGALALAFGLILVVGSGCRNTHPGSSFGQQIDHLNWSAKVLIAQPHWKESLWDDVTQLTDPEWGSLEESFILIGW